MGGNFLAADILSRVKVRVQFRVATLTLGERIWLWGRLVVMTELFHKTMTFAANDDDRGELMHKVWENTPWMVNVYTDGHNTDHWYDVMQWCQGEFGQERWPLHGIQGDWLVVLGEYWINRRSAHK